MDYVEGDTLSKVWLSFSEDQKLDIARQLRDILKAMRSIEPPEGTRIGACDGGPIRDTRGYTTHTAPPCRDAKEFNDYLISGLVPTTPPVLRSAFAGRLRADHRVVFTHGDLAPRNIIVRDGKIAALLDWEVSGWYPEYWEYVKFFRVGTSELVTCGICGGTQKTYSPRHTTTNWSSMLHCPNGNGRNFNPGHDLYSEASPKMARSN